MITMSEYLSTSEAARRMNVSEGTVRDLCRRGILSDAFQERDNGPWQIPACSVEDWLKPSFNEEGSEHVDRKLKFIELSIKAHFEEYQALMGEIKLRLEAQHTLLNVTVILVGGGLAFLTTAINAGNFAMLLFVPIVFLIIVWWYIAYQLMIGQVARYIYGPLAQKVNSLLENHPDEDRLVWRWLSFQYEDFTARTKHIYLYNTVNLVKYTPWFIPSLLSVFAFLSLHDLYQQPWQSFEIILLVADGVLWLITFVTLVFFLGWRPPKKKSDQDSSEDG